MKKLILILTFGILSCTSNNDETVDNNTTSDFQLLFQNLINSNYTDEVTFDTEIHEYTFVLSTNKEISKIGYQSQPGIATTPYLMEIVDNSTSNIIYSGAHIFSSTETSYRTPHSVINLQAGVSYTIKRIQINWGNNIENTIGRLIMNTPMSFPYTHGIVTITSTNFHQNGGPIKDIAIPFIDFIFK
jgi:hypothetical protein